MNPVVSLDAPKAPLSPGETGAVTVRVLNPGTTVESYKIDVLGSAKAWATAPAEALALFPDSSGEAVVKLNPPNHGGPRAGTISVGIRVASVSSSGGSTVEEFDIVIAPEVAVAGKLAPPNSRGWRKGRHRLVLTNDGNVDTSVFIDARDPDELVDCRLAQEAVVPAGDTVAVPLVVVPLRSRLLGRPTAYPFEVEVFPNAGQAVALRGSMRQRPPLSPQVLVAAVAILAVVVAVLALGRSDPTSNAQQRAGVTTLATVEVSTSTTAAESTTTIASAESTTVPSTTPLPAAPTPGAAPTPAPATPSGSQTGAQTQSGPAPQSDTPAVDPASQTPAPAPPVVTAAPAPPPPPAPIVPTTPMRLGPTYAGDGVIYGIDTAGRLLFYQDLRQDGTSNGATGEGWHPAGGSQVGCGFQGFQALIGGEGGVIYAIDASGTFRWYQDLARNGSNDACNAGGNWIGGAAMGTGWTGYKHIFYGGSGIIYAIDPAGNLRFCRDVNHQFNPPTCPIIGVGWGDFRQVFASGAPGVIYAITQSGELDYYRDTLRNGTNGGNSGWIGPLPVGNTWQTMYHVFGGAINSSVYPNGVIYAIASNGDLQWRRDTLQDGSNGVGGSQGWLGYSTVGIGWQGFL